MNASRLAHTSGNWNNGSNTGAFHLNVNNSTSNANTNIGTHLMYFNNPFFISIYNVLSLTLKVNLRCVNE